MIVHGLACLAHDGWMTMSTDVATAVPAHLRRHPAPQQSTIQSTIGKTIASHARNSVLLGSAAALLLVLPPLTRLGSDLFGLAALILPMTLGATLAMAAAINATHALRLVRVRRAESAPPGALDAKHEVTESDAPSWADRMEAAWFDAAEVVWVEG